VRFLAILTTLLLVGGCAREAPVPGHPNVVLLILDTLRADAVGAYGQPGDASAAIDAYAARGVRFDRVIAQATWTRPSIGSMLTSQYPRTLGIYHEAEQALAPEFLTLAEAFRTAGYRTLGATANPNINSYFHFDQGFDAYVDSDSIFQFMPGDASKRGAALPLARHLFEEILAAVDASDERPVYIQVNAMEVHEAQRMCGIRNPTPRIERNCYQDALRRLSRAVGTFLDALLAKPGFERTLVAIVSDHGESHADEHETVAAPRTHGFLVYPTLARVPWILFDSEGTLPAGRVVEQPVRLLELMPTLLELAGVPAPDGLVGRSLVPLLRADGGVELPPAFVVESEMRKTRKIAAYQGSWLLVENRDGHAGTEPVELQAFAGPCDGARSNQAQAEPARAQELEAYLARWEVEHPRSAPVPPGGALDAETTEQLRALGYLD